MDGGLFSGGWGAGFARVFQVEYWVDGGDVPWQATVVVRFRLYIEANGHGCLHVCLGLFFIWLLKNKAKPISFESKVSLCVKNSFIN